MNRSRNWCTVSCTRMLLWIYTRMRHFFIVFSLLFLVAVVNHDGRDGTAPDPLVWSAGARPKRRRLVHAVRDQAFLPGPPNLGTLHWPAGGADLGVGGISYVELSLFMNFVLARGSPWRRLTLVIFVQDAQFQCRLFLLVQALTFGALVVLLVL